MRRVLDRCAGLAVGRWHRPGADGISPAQAVHELGQEFADLAAGLEGGPPRTIPRLRLHGLADQLAVLTRDALAGADDTARTTVAVRLVELRRRL